MPAPCTIECPHSPDVPVLPRDITVDAADIIMACFCGCETYVKDQNGFHIGCTECGHGPQNHNDEYREAAKKNTERSQKRDVDFG